MKKLIYAGLMALMIPALTNAASYDSSSSSILNVPLIEQEQENWSWAGAAQSILQYYGNEWRQCDIAEYARTHSTYRNYGSEDCCKNPSDACNNLNELATEKGSIQDILKNIGPHSMGSTLVKGILTEEEAIDSIQQKRPFIILAGQNFIVGHGLKNGNLYYMDPWEGEGYGFNKYGDKVNGKQWYRTLIMAEAPSSLEVEAPMLNTEAPLSLEMEAPMLNTEAPLSLEMEAPMLNAEALSSLEVKASMLKAKAPSPEVNRNITTVPVKAEYWTKYANTIISSENNYTKIAVGNNPAAAYLYLDNFSDLKIDDTGLYQISFKAYTDTIVENGTVNIRHFSSRMDKQWSITNKETTFTARVEKNLNDKRPYINFSNLPPKTVIYINNDIEIIKIIAEEPTPSYPIPNGFPWRGTTIIFDENASNKKEDNKNEKTSLERLFEDLKEANVKHIRMNILGTKSSLRKKAFLNRLKEKVNNVYIPLLEKHGMGMVLGMESIPYDKAKCNSKKNVGFWKDPDCMQNFRDTAKFLAKTFNGTSNDIILAYQFMSEPVWSDDGIIVKTNVPSNWRSLSEELVKIVRKHDRNRFIIWSRGHWGFSSNYKKTEPFKDNRIIYNYHEFDPMYYTHQGINKRKFGKTYPEEYAKKRIKENLDNMIEFRNKHKVPILSGSYAVACWIPDRVEWLKDLHSAYKKENISSFNFIVGAPFHGWDLRYTSDYKGEGTEPHYEINENNNAWAELKRYWSDN
ncbi:MAG: cellulase family glycosylhydrolase [Candidatus Thiodiazotropha sp.]